MTAKSATPATPATPAEHESEEALTAFEAPAVEPHVQIVLLVHTIGAKYGDPVWCDKDRAAYLVAEGHAAYPA